MAVWNWIAIPRFHPRPSHWPEITSQRCYRCSSAQKTYHPARSVLGRYWQYRLSTGSRILSVSDAIVVSDVGGLTMRSQDRCEVCHVGRMLVYVTRRGERFIVRYRRCNRCSFTSKAISMKASESSTNFLSSSASNAMIQPSVTTSPTGSQTNA